MITRKLFIVIAACCLFLPAVLLFPLTGCAGLPSLPPPPPLLVPVPPPVVLVPGTYAYFAPDVDVDLMFYGGFWYRPYGGGWYRASHYNGPWGFVPVGRVPGVLINLPPGFRNVPPGHQRIPYGHLKKNWKAWERDKHWDKPGKPMKKDKSAKKKLKEGGKFDRGDGKGHGKGHGR
jgi:hypothetical protein